MSKLNYPKNKKGNLKILKAMYKELKKDIKHGKFDLQYIEYSVGDIHSGLNFVSQEVKWAVHGTKVLP